MRVGVAVAWGGNEVAVEAPTAMGRPCWYLGIVDRELEENTLPVGIVAAEIEHFRALCVELAVSDLLRHVCQDQHIR